MLQPSTPYPRPPKTTDALGFAAFVEECPSDLLDRLIPGDPLEIRTLVRARLAERALLWDEEALCLRALALCAHRTVQARRRRLDQDWLLGFVDEAIGQLALGGDPESEGGALSIFEQLGLPLDFEAGSIAKACRALNCLPELQRLCFQALIICGRDLDDVARDLDRDGGTVGRAARVALDEFFGCLVSPEQLLGDH